jgi:hypothetical protein
MGALLYALKALEASGSASDADLKLWLARLPGHLQTRVSSGVNLRLKKLGIEARVGEQAGKTADQTCN